MTQPEIDLERDLRAQTWDVLKDNPNTFVFAEYEMQLPDGTVTKVDENMDYMYQFHGDRSQADWNDMLEACFGMTMNVEQNQEFMDQVKKGDLLWTGKYYLQYAHGGDEGNENLDMKVAVSEVTYGIASEGSTEGDAFWRSKGD